MQAQAAIKIVVIVRGVHGDVPVRARSIPLAGSRLAQVGAAQASVLRSDVSRVLSLRIFQGSCVAKVG